MSSRLALPHTVICDRPLQAMGENFPTDFLQIYVLLD